MSRRLKNSSYRQQRGQVMPYVAFMIVVLAAAALLVYDIGYMINSRIQAQNAADAAALAAVAVKINKHHMDSLVRGAMTQEAIISQAEIKAAQAVAIQAIVKGENTVIIPPTPGQPNPVQPILGEMKDLGDRYRAHANKAYKHAVKLHRERLALQAWYRWLEKRGPTAVREAARLGYALNMQGYDDLNDPTLRQNLENVLVNNSDLLENKGQFGEVGGFTYANEAAAMKGMFGKSFVEMQTRASSSDGGAALLRYLQQFEMTSNAAAQLLKRPERAQLSPSLIDINWYSPYLMAIEGDTPTQVGH